MALRDGDSAARHRRCRSLFRPYPAGDAEGPSADPADRMGLRHAYSPHARAAVVAEGLEAAIPVAAGRVHSLADPALPQPRRAHPQVGHRLARGRHARVDDVRPGAVDLAQAHPSQVRQHAPARLQPSSEDRGDRRCAGRLRRHRHDRPALGHPRALRAGSTPGRTISSRTSRTSKSGSPARAPSTRMRPRSRRSSSCSSARSAGRSVSSTPRASISPRARLPRRSARGCPPRSPPRS